MHLPPSLMPLALSMKAAMGDVPMKLPMMLDRPSTQKANVCRGNSFFAFMKPAASYVGISSGYFQVQDILR